MKNLQNFNTPPAVNVAELLPSRYEVKRVRSIRGMRTYVLSRTVPGLLSCILSEAETSRNEFLRRFGALQFD